MDKTKDIHGALVTVGSSVRLLSLSEDWLHQLPAEEASELQSMIGKIFDVVEVDQYGGAWIVKSSSEEKGDSCRSHSLALEPHEMEIVAVKIPSPAGGRGLG